MIFLNILCRFRDDSPGDRPYRLLIYANDAQLLMPMSRCGSCTVKIFYSERSSPENVTGHLGSPSAFSVLFDAAPKDMSWSRE
jgi:hypothetical protein